MPDQDLRERLADHESRLRYQERWTVDHDAWVKERWDQQAKFNERILRTSEKANDKQDAQAKEISAAYTEIGKMKVRLGLVMALAGGIGGIVSAILTAAAIYGLGIGH